MKIKKILFILSLSVFLFTTITFAKEKDNIKKTEIENLTKIKDLETKIKKDFQSVNMNFNNIPITQALKQSKKLKEEKNEILKNFEDLIKTNRDSFIKCYDEQIKVSVDLSPKKQSEQDGEYQKRLEQNEQLKEKLEQEKANSIFEYNKKELKLMYNLFEPFSKKETEILKKYYSNENEEKAVVDSVGVFDIEHSYFVINIKYKGKIYKFNYKFMEIGRNVDTIESLSLETAKVMHDMPKFFVVEPLYKINLSKMTSEFTSFRVKHTGTGVETIFDINEDNTKALASFKDKNIEIIPYEIYLDLLLIEKLSKTPIIKPQIIKELKLIDILLKDDYYKEFKNIINKNNVITHIFAGPYHTVGLKADGTVVACGSNDYKQCNVDSLNFYIYDVALSYFNTVGLSLDSGIVKYCGWNGLQEIQNLKIWNNIISVKIGYSHAVGLKKDGTVVACGDNSKGQCNVKDWNNIVAIAVGDNHTLGLKKDGTVVACGDNLNGQCDVKLWKDIKLIAAKFNNTVAIKKDGMVVACGDNTYEQCNTSNWQNIVDVSIGHVNIAGLRKDGTVVISGDNSRRQCNINDWKDIVKIELGYYYIVGLKKDGTVIACGYNAYEQCNTNGWKDIVEISVAHSHTLGLNKDGNVVATGWNEYGQCNVQDLNFNNYEKANINEKR